MVQVRSTFKDGSRYTKGTQCVVTDINSAIHGCRVYIESLHGESVIVLYYDNLWMMPLRWLSSTQGAA